MRIRYPFAFICVLLCGVSLRAQVSPIPLPQALLSSMELARHYRAGSYLPRTLLGQLGQVEPTPPSAVLYTTPTLGLKRSAEKLCAIVLQGFDC